MGYGWDDFTDDLSDAGGAIVDAGEAAVDGVVDGAKWVGNTASDAWNGTVDGVSDAWDGVVDWWNDDGRPDLIEKAVDNGSLDDAPTHSEITANLNKLKPFVLEGYRRGEAYEQCGTTIKGKAWMKEPNERASVNLKDKGDNRYVQEHGSTQGTMILGLWRWSETLNFYMPEYPYDGIDDDYENGDLFSQTWKGSSASDDVAINNSATRAADTDFDGIEETLQTLYDQTDTTSMSDLVTAIHNAHTAMRDIKDEHYGEDKSTGTLLDLWNEWKGTDATAAVETFGNHVPQSMLDQVTAMALLNFAASAEATAQVTALCVAYNQIADAWETAVNRTNPTPFNDGDASASKMAGLIAVNRVPFLGDAIAVFDFSVEFATGGDIQSPAGNISIQILDRICTEKNVPDKETATQIVTMLNDAADNAVKALNDSRDKYHDNELYAPASETWNGNWVNGTISDVIPGYLE